MLHICCVQKGDYLGRGAEYVNVLHDMVRRNLAAGTAGEFVCFTDNPDLGYHEDIVLRPLPDGIQGWWNKLWLFSPGLFQDGDRVAYFDLDTLVINSLDDILKYAGEFAMLRDFYRDGGFQSSVMLWRAGFGSHLWEQYVAEGYPTHDLGGDQSWIEKRTRPDALQDTFSGQFVSYKVHCQKYPPKGAGVIVFHGNPRPHEVVEGWVSDVWKIGGVGSLEISVYCNTEMETLKRNVEHSLSLGLPELKEEAANDRAVCIVGGGLSLGLRLEELKEKKESGCPVWGLNNSPSYLRDNGIEVDGQWIVDARPINAEFVVRDDACRKYLASQCDASVFKMAGRNVTLYHEIASDEFLPKGRGVTLIGGGTTVAMKAICGAYALGYRTIHIYGLDSSFGMSRHHIYDQPCNDKDVAVTVNVGNVKFQAAPWMIRQVEDFVGLANELANMGCEIHVHCGGLLGYVAVKLAEARDKPIEVDGDIVKYDDIWRPVTDQVSVSAVIDELWKIEKIVGALPDKSRRTVIQAGGHVGLFANDMSDRFSSVVTFEPDPTNYKCLIRNVSKDNVTVFNCAIGSEDGAIALVERDGNNSGSIGIDPNGVATVSQVAIDGLGLQDVDLIYLDIEGMEGPALYGASGTVQKFRPLIVCENKGLDEVSGTEGMLRLFMSEHGYRKVARFMRDDVFAPLERFEEFQQAFAA